MERQLRMPENIHVEECMRSVWLGAFFRFSRDDEILATIIPKRITCTFVHTLTLF